jgi:hypothetical protein
LTDAGGDIRQSDIDRGISQAVAQQFKYHK